MCLCFGFALCVQVQAGQRPSWPTAATSQHSRTNRQQLRQEWLYKQRASGLGYIPHDARAKALQQIQESKTTPLLRGPLVLASPRWVNIGPAPIVNLALDPPQPAAGRVTAIAVDPTNSTHWLIGTAMGGVWETHNGGINWTPKTDDQASLAIGAIAFAPSNPFIIYAGTGEPNGGGDVYGGAGLLKSTDGGATWRLLAANKFAGGSFSSIIVDPSNPNVVLAATTSGGIAGKGGDPVPYIPGTGVYKSTDGGTNWVAKLQAGSFLGGYSTDLKADPSNFNHQLATSSPDPASINGNNFLYQSLDAGETWTQLNGPWSQYAQIGGGVGRMQLAISPSSPNTAYASARDGRGDRISNPNFSRLLGIWRTDNAWAATPTWTALPQPSAEDVGTQMDYDQVIITDPANPSIVYFGSTPLFKYNGTSWTNIGADYNGPNGAARLVHPDQHALAWAGSRLVIGNDGGVWSTTDGGATFFNHNTNDLCITQFYFGAVHPRGRNFALGGAQDNSSAAWFGTNGWVLTGPADGGDCAISPNDPDNNWVTSWDLVNVLRLTGAGQFPTWVYCGACSNQGGPFIPKLALAPTNENIMILSAFGLVKTTNLFSAPIPTWYQDALDLASPISAVAFAPSDLSGNTYAWATEDGKFRVTSVGVGGFSVDANFFAYVTALGFAPNNANTLYITFSGFSPTQGGHLLKNVNVLAFGSAWTDISPPVNLPHNSLAIDPGDPNNIYVGTDIGVWHSSDGGGTWTHMGPETGMPNVAVFDLKIQPGTGRVFAFTFGRGAFMLDPNATNNPPTIVSFNPTNGPPGTSVTIIGTKFNNASAVQFGGINAAGFVVNASTQIVATVPAGALTGPISVTTPTGSAASSAAFTVTTAPAISSFAPTAGNVGTLVTLSGANLTGATNVSFGAAAATFTVNSSTQITATVPASATTDKITVRTPSGTAQSAGLFTVTTTPVISGFTPGNGAIGSSVTITGANFVSVNGVAFNGVSSVSPVVNSAVQITATVPAGATTGHITVTTASGTAQSAASFSVIPAPSITTFSPASGSAGTGVMITGANFSGATAVTFNGLSAAGFSLNSATQITANAPPGVTTGPLRVTTPGGTSVSAGSFTVVSRPANDNFASAQVISGSSGTVSGSNVAATKEAGEPVHAGNDGGRSIWYRWTAPAGGTWTFNTAGSSFDTLLAVYTGNALSNLVAVASSDNSPGTNTSSVTFTATNGTVYQIAVDGFLADAGELAMSVAPDSGAVVLNWDLAPNFPPQIASFSPGSGPAGTSVSIAGMNFLGTTGVQFNGAGAAFTVNSNSQITATVPAGATTGPLKVLKPSGTATSGLNFVVGVFPANDNFANAQVISGSAGLVTGSSTGATKEAGEPNHAGNVGGSSVWYAWTAPSSGTWEFDTAGSSFDTLLAVYTGTIVGGLSLVASNAPSGGVTTSQLQFSAANGTIYRIAVDGYGGASGNLVCHWANTNLLPVISEFAPASGGVGTLVTVTGTNLNGVNAVRFAGVGTASFTSLSTTQFTATVPAGAATGPISVSTTNGTAQSATSFLLVGNPPANDNFSNRLAMVGAVVTVTDSNTFATREPNEPFHAGNLGGASVWWTWTAPSNGTYTITTRSSSFDTVLGVYIGTSVGSLFTIASNDDGPNMGTASQVTFNAAGGTAYQIAVDGYNGDSGNIILSVFPAIPAQVIYFTGFEGYNYAALSGQYGWTSAGPGQNGVLFNAFGDYGNQAYVGYSSPTPGAATLVYYPTNYTPDLTTRPVVAFGVNMEIFDPSVSVYDNFGWAVYNQNGQLLFFLEFNNSNLSINYQLNDGSGYHPTGQSFQNGYIYSLELDMDFGRNLWNAFLGGVPIVQNQPLSATNNVALNLGLIAATWLQTPGTNGNNYMIFDNYLIAAFPSQLPRIVTPPQTQTNTVGATAALLVVADSALPLTYQWQFNGTPITGATDPTLTLNNLTFNQAGNYTVVVANAAGSVTSAPPAVLTVAQLPNLTPYKPSTWSDKIITATNSASTTDAGIIYSHQDVYVTWAVVNNSSNGNISQTFYTELFVDGVLSGNWLTPGLNAGFYTHPTTSLDLGKLSVGSHTLRIDTDTTDVVPESNKNDNSYTKTIIVSSTNNTPPQLSSPVRTPNGPFQLTLNGIPLRSYELQASTNLTNWSVLSTVTITNGSGVFPYSDPTATNYRRRFYRGRLLSP